METLGKVVRHVRTFVNLTRILLPSSQSAKRTGTKDPRSKDFPDLQKRGNVRGLVSKSLTRGDLARGSTKCPCVGMNSLCVGAVDLKERLCTSFIKKAQVLAAGGEGFPNERSRIHTYSKLLSRKSIRRGLYCSRLPRARPMSFDPLKPLLRGSIGRYPPPPGIFSDGKYVGTFNGHQATTDSP
jgi:hypothetical protein